MRIDNRKTFTLRGALVTVIAASLMIFGLGMGIGRGYVWRSYDKTPAVERQFTAAQERVASNPNNADNRVDLGWAYFQRGMYNEALAEYKKALDLNERHYTALYNLGLAYAKVDKHDRAISAFERAIEVVPQAFQAHFDLAKSYVAAGKLDDAVKELQTAYRINPGSVDVIYELGLTFEKQGKLDEARYQFESALKFDPKFRPAIEGLARIK